jgi:cobalt-precorrin 5A hydrolase
MKIAIIAISKGAFELAETLQAKLPDAAILPQDKIFKLFNENWQKYDAFICIMATGIVVRAIAPLLISKQSDPCVVVVDELGQYAISLLSGHLGGGNALATRVASELQGQAVITTASDTLGLVPLDIWAKTQHLTVTKADMTRASAMLVNNGELKLYTDIQVQSLPKGLIQCVRPDDADIIISNRSCFTDEIVFYPRNLTVGTGCNRNTPLSEFTEALTDIFSDLGLSVKAIKTLASIDKRNDEEGLLEFAKQQQLSIEFFTKDEINRVTGVEISAAPLKAVSAIRVAEP